MEAINHIKKLVIICDIFCSCNSYENKDKYTVEVGDLIEIYYSTNSCCYYCLSNEEDLKNVELIEIKTIDKGPKNCDGCNFINSFVIKAKSVGIDTVKLKRLQATSDCSNNDVVPETYIIDIK